MIRPELVSKASLSANKHATPPHAATDLATQPTPHAPPRSVQQQQEQDEEAPGCARTSRSQVKDVSTKLQGAQRIPDLIHLARRHVELVAQELGEAVAAREEEAAAPMNHLLAASLAAQQPRMGNATGAAMPRGSSSSTVTSGSMSVRASVSIRGSTTEVGHGGNTRGLPGSRRMLVRTNSIQPGTARQSGSGLPGQLDAQASYGSAIGSTRSSRMLGGPVAQRSRHGGASIVAKEAAALDGMKPAYKVSVFGVDERLLDFINCASARERVLLREKGSAAAQQRQQEAQQQQQQDREGGARGSQQQLQQQRSQRGESPLDASRLSGPLVDLGREAAALAPGASPKPPTPFGIAMSAGMLQLSPAVEDSIRAEALLPSAAALRRAQLPVLTPVQVHQASAAEVCAAFADHLEGQGLERGPAEALAVAQQVLSGGEEKVPRGVLLLHERLLRVWKALDTPVPERYKLVSGGWPGWRGWGGLVGLVESVHVATEASV